MPAKISFAFVPSKLAKNAARACLDDSDNTAMNDDAESIDSDWEEGRTLVRLEDDDECAAAEEEARLHELLDSFAAPFEGKVADNKRATLGELEPTLDLITSTHAYMRDVHDAQYLKGLKTFDNASGQRHGAIAAQRENVAAGSSRAMDALEKLIDELRKLYEIRDQCLAELQEALEAIGMAALADLALGDDELDRIELAAEKREKDMLKKSAKDNGGVGKLKKLLKA